MSLGDVSSPGLSHCSLFSASWWTRCAHHARPPDGVITLKPRAKVSLPPSGSVGFLFFLINDQTSTASITLIRKDRNKT